MEFRSGEKKAEKRGPFALAAIAVNYIGGGEGQKEMRRAGAGGGKGKGDAYTSAFYLRG